MPTEMVDVVSSLASSNGRADFVSTPYTGSGSGKGAAGLSSRTRGWRRRRTSTITATIINTRQATAEHTPATTPIDVSESPPSLSLETPSMLGAWGAPGEAKGTVPVGAVDRAVAAIESVH